MSSCVDMSTCSALPLIANLEFAPRETGDLKTNSPPWACAASATPTQLDTVALARVMVAGSPPSLCGLPIGCLSVRSTCGAPSSKRAADQVEHGGEAKTATHRLPAASDDTCAATSSLARSCPIPPRS
eukprot:2142693-Pleurochrysis_carterae.AAC.2